MTPFQPSAKHGEVRREERRADNHMSQATAGLVSAAAGYPSTMPTLSVTVA